MKILYRPQRGGLAESMAEVKEFSTIKEMFENIASEWKEPCGRAPFSIEDIYIRYYGYDSRIDWETYLVCAGRMLNKKHNIPQAIGFCTFKAKKKSENELELLNRITVSWEVIKKDSPIVCIFYQDKDGKVYMLRGSHDESGVANIGKEYRTCFNKMEQWKKEER